MIDRIEELLESLAAEDEEEEKDVLARKRGAVVSSGLRSERSESGEAPEGRTAIAQSESLGRVANRRSVTTGEPGDGETGDRSGGRTVGEILAERSGLAAGGTETAAESGSTAGELWKYGPVWTAQNGAPGPDAVLSAATVQRAVQTEKALPPVRHGGANLEPVGAGGSDTAQSGLEGLYRQTVRGLQPAAPALPPEQTGRTGRTREPESAVSLAVDELDRAVRRDSRRYDGGMNIY